MVVYHPAASQPAKEAGEFLGKKTGSVSDCTKALKVYPGVVSGSFGCVSFSKLWLWDTMKFFQVDWKQKSNNTTHEVMVQVPMKMHQLSMVSSQVVY